MHAATVQVLLSLVLFTGETSKGTRQEVCSFDLELETVDPTPLRHRVSGYESTTPESGAPFEQKPLRRFFFFTF